MLRWRCDNVEEAKVQGDWLMIMLWYFQGFMLLVHYAYITRTLLSFRHITRTLLSFRQPSGVCGSGSLRTTSPSPQVIVAFLFTNKAAIQSQPVVQTNQRSDDSHVIEVQHNSRSGCE